MACLEAMRGTEVFAEGLHINGKIWLTGTGVTGNKLLVRAWKPLTSWIANCKEQPSVWSESVF